MFCYFFLRLKHIPLLLLLALSCTMSPVQAQIQELKPASHNFNTLPPANNVIEIRQALKAAKPFQQTASDSGAALYKHVLKQSIKIKYYFGAAAALIGLSNVYKNKSMLAESQKASQDAIYYAKKDKESNKLLAVAYNNAGRSAVAFGDYKAATEYYYKAADAVEKIKDSQLPLEMVYSNLGIVIEDDSLRLVYLKKSEDISRAKGNMMALGLALLNRSFAYEKLNDNINEELTLKEALQLGIQQHDTLLHRRALIKLADNALRKKMPERALQYIKDGEKAGLDENVFFNNIPNFSRSEAYMQLGDYKMAEYYSKVALDIARTYAMREQVSEGYRLLSLIYSKTGQYEKAYRNHVSYLELKDSIRDENIARNNQMLQAKYELAQKDKSLSQQQLQILTQQRKLSKNKVFLVAISLGAVLLCFLFFFVQRSYRNKQRLLLKSQELSQLKAMIKGEETERGRIARELHDGVGGMLVAINMNLGMLNKDHPLAGLSRIEGMLDDAGREIRKTAHNLMPDVLEKHDLREALAIYCDKINDAGILQLMLQCDEPIPIDDAVTSLILYRIIQELVQNIVKHAHATKAGIYILQYENKLAITVEDNGKGFDPLSVKKGVGLDNVKYRVKALHGEVNISSRPGHGTTIHIELEPEKLRSALH